MANPQAQSDASKARPARAWDTLRVRVLLVLVLTNLPLLAIAVGLAFDRASSDRAQTETAIQAEVRLAARSVSEAIEGAKQLLGTITKTPAALSKEPQQCEPLFASVLETFAERYANIWLVDETGAVVCSVVPYTGGINQAFREWFRDARDTRKFSMSRFSIGVASGARVMTASYPMMRGDRFEGVVAISIKLEWLIRAMNQPGARNDIVVGILDGNGRIVLPDGVDRKRVPARTLVPATIGRSAMIEALGDDGKTYVYVVESLFGDDLYILGIAPVETIYQRVWLAFAELLGPLLLILILTFVAVGLAIDQLVLRPLDNLTQAVIAYRRRQSAEPNPSRRAPLEIRRLGKQFTKLAQAVAGREERLTEMVRLRDTLIEEVHHRVKNNLQLVASLLGIQAGRVRAPETREALSIARKRVESLAALHRHLYEHSEAQNVNMRDFAIELCRHLHRTVAGEETRIDLSCRSDQFMLTSKAAVAVGLLINEAVTNCLKYAFPDERSGTIEVELCIDRTHATLRIKDDGVGIDGARPDPNATGLGQMLLQSLSAQLGGTLTVNQRGGTEIVVVFPRDGEPEPTLQQPPA